MIMLVQCSCAKESDFSKELADQEINYPIIAHSHNDYERKNPIYRALECGFQSLEVDIVYDGEELRVSHDGKNLREKPELEQYYLVPLLEELVEEKKEIILLVDVKEYNERLLEKLNNILGKHEQNLVPRNSIPKEAQKIKVLLSGDIPREEILLDDSNEYLFIDGRVSDLEKNIDSNLMPIISMDFSRITKWKGILKPSKNIIEEITTIVESVHEQGKLIRFWNTKDRDAIWLTLIELEVDIIGVDNTELFYEVMEKNNLLE